MDRAYRSNVSGTPPTPPDVPLLGFPQTGNPATSQLATKPGQYWYYMITEEIRNAILAAGLTPDTSSVNQLASAILALAGGAASETAAGKVELATSAETAAGLSSSLAVHPAGLAALLGSKLDSRPGHSYATPDWTWWDKQARLIVQWGSATAGGNSATLVTFPVPFTAIFYVGAELQLSGATTTTVSVGSGPGPSPLANVNFYNTNAATATWFWLAFGTTAP